MGMKINYNAVNQAEKGTVIYAANDQVDSICIILKGRVLAVNSGTKILFGSGSFLGITDLYRERFLNSYIAYDDLTFYCFPIKRKEDLIDIISSNKDYKGLIVASLVKYLNEADKIFNSLQTHAKQLYNFMISNYGAYLETSKKLGYPVKTIGVMQNMEPLVNMLDVEDKKLLYYKECSKITLAVWKEFCAVGNTVTLYLVDELVELIEQLTTECIEMSAYISEVFDGLMNNSEACLFKNFTALAISIEEAGGYNDELLVIIDNIVDEINVIEKLFNDKIGCKLNVDRKRMEEIYYTLLSKESNRKDQVKNQFQYMQSEIQQVDSELNNSLKQIIQYAKLDDEKAHRLEQLFLNYINLKDKHSTEDAERSLRKHLSEQFYNLYELVFFRAYQDKEVSRVINLFLKYGFLDERLLNKEQLKDLYYLEEEKQEETGPCHIYNIKDWLIHIYEGDKEPSKNEFDLDYKDMLRDRRKKAEITEAEEKVLQVDLMKKVNYEIHNMFRYNHRIVNGQITTFVPFLCGDNMIHDIRKLFVSGSRVNVAIQELLAVDYSIFHRESMYVNNTKRIAKEYIMEQIFPDIILMPTVGSNGVMWQEITGKRKSSEGRFFLPIFTELVVKDLLVKVFGRYRWELCRSIQGSAWNNIKYKSLTSEYSDYIQFYRKNRDLSEEVKEKIKLQIQKGKNNYREIFVIDYEAWIKNESNGALRLNKVARELLATYCPFNRTIREKLMGQPLFADAMARFTRNNYKKIKDLEARYRALEKDKIELTEELMETFIFYRDL